MAIFLEVMGGPGEGSRYKINAGTTLGRSKADIVVKDPKVSGTHAQIEKNPDGQFVISDLNSSNGIHLNGRRVKKITLLPGVSFEVGRTLFRVLEVNETEAEDYSRVVTWRSMLPALLFDFPEQTVDELKPVEAFSPALRLTVLQGIQSEQEFFLGYGPRTAGSASLDIELFDPASPEEAFRLLPGPGMVQIERISPRLLLNGNKVEKEMLKEGDLISIGDTVIRVSYY